ncbi:MAG: D-cysteine desulfhydrase family protein [Pseudomonadales bacterium]|nr:D-cysteine desulfhydrase family protein [Pseudomonadales bacterium]
MKVPRLELARLPTPLVPLERLSAMLDGPTIWLKRDDMTDTSASGNKLRKLEFSVARALDEGATMLITCGGVQSNHCRATAIVAASLGLGCHLILRGSETSPADGNLLLDRLAGANISWVNHTQYEELDAIYEDLEAQYRQAGEVPFSIPVGASDETGLWGYIEAARELRDDFERLDIDPGYIVSATGSGGTLGGLIIGRERYGLDATIVGFNVCDDEQWFQQKIRGDLDHWKARYQETIDVGKLSINIIDGYVGPGYGRAEPGVFKTIKWVARTEGVFLDPVYTGKAFDALLQELEKGRFRDTRDIVFLHTGGIFGLFPMKEQFG